MNIWEWVYVAMDDLRRDGHERLATIVDELPRLAIDNRYAEAEAMAKEGIALARAAGLPWITVFLRHWDLQARVSQRGDGAVALADAVAALDYAHTEEAKGCPQAICTVQDLAICYGNADGPGWAAERLAVADEALERIDETWPCFACISAERASALIDLGRPQEAYETMIEAKRASLDDNEYSLIDQRLAAMLAVGRYDECIKEANGFLAGQRDPEPKRRSVRVRLAEALARRGDLEAARRALPPLDELAANRMDNSLPVLRLLIDSGGLPNDAEVGAALRRVLAEQEEAGCWSDALETAIAHVELAAARGGKWAAEDGLARAERVATQLRSSERVGDDLARLRSLVDAVVPSVADLPDDADALVDAVTEDDDDDGDGDGAHFDTEGHVERMLAAAERWPDDPRVVALLGAAFMRAGARASAFDALEAFVARVPGEHEAARMLSEVALASGLADDVERAVRVIEPSSELLALWLRARHAWSAADYDACIERCQALLELSPNAQNTRRLLASAAREAERFDVAVAATVDLRAVEDVEWTDHDDWRLVVDATAAGRWDLVREASARLGMELEGDEGPVEEAWHGAVVRFPDDTQHLGLRTGPATVTIQSVAHPDYQQRYNDVVVIEPAPLEEYDEETEYPTYAPVATLSTGGYVAYSIAGMTPDEDELAAKRAQLRDDGVQTWVYEAGEAPMIAPTTGRTGTYFFATLAVLPGREADVHRQLSDAFSGPDRGLGWPGLARAAGDDEAAVAHEAFLDALEWD